MLLHGFLYPIQGQVVNVKVKPGDKVQKGAQQATPGNPASQPGLYDTPAQSTSKPAYNKKNGTTSDAPASPKQVKYLLDLARQYNVSPEQIKAKFNVPSLESLTKTQCSRAIDELSGKAA